MYCCKLKVDMNTTPGVCYFWQVQSSVDSYLEIVSCVSGISRFILLAFPFTDDLGLNVKGIRVKTILLVAKKKWCLKVSIEI